MILRRRLFPELARFPNDRGRKAAWTRATRRVFADPRAWLVVLLILGLDIALTFSLPALGVPMAWRGRVRGIGLVLTVTLVSLTGLLFRRTIRHSLRRDLRDVGITLCLACGYDLAGLRSSRCPECGAADDDTLRDSRDGS